MAQPFKHPHPRNPGYAPARSALALIDRDLIFLPLKMAEGSARDHITSVVAISGP